jgi:hypothetical protein
LKDDGTFHSNPYMYNQLVKKDLLCGTFILSTFEGDLNEENDPHGEDVPNELSSFCNNDVDITTHDDWWWFHNLLLMYGRADYENYVLNMMTDHLFFNKVY